MSDETTDSETPVMTPLTPTTISNLMQNPMMFLMLLMVLGGQGADLFQSGGYTNEIRELREDISEALDEINDNTDRLDREQRHVDDLEDEVDELSDLVDALEDRLKVVEMVVDVEP